MRRSLGLVPVLALMAGAAEAAEVANAASFRAAFDAANGRPRLVMLLSPT